MSKSFLSIFTFLWVALLSGCASMNGQFDCPVGSGVSCKSLKEIDMMVSQGQFSEANASSGVKTNISYSRTLAQQAPIRIKEKILKVWFAPFVDSDDNYHKENEVFTVIDKSFWKGDPVTSVEDATS